MSVKYLCNELKPLTNIQYSNILFSLYKTGRVVVFVVSSILVLTVNFRCLKEIGFTRAIHVLHVLNLSAPHYSSPNLKYAVNRKMLLNGSEFVRVFLALDYLCIAVMDPVIKRGGFGSQ